MDWAEGVSVPMHTAMRLALRVATSIRSRHPNLSMCFFGLYAGMAQDLTVTSSSDAIVAGEYEDGLVAWADGRDPGAPVQLSPSPSRVPRRHLLPELGRYTHLVAGGEERLVGSVAASRGCSHRCRHCPVPVVYQGPVRPVDEAAVIADVDQPVAAGASHISFSDPDFLNAPHHSRRVVAAVHRRHPTLTFDATIKVEHILRHVDALPELAESGCAFVVSAFESVSDPILERLDKGHTAADASTAVTALRAHDIEIRPSWLPFTPWTTAENLVDLMDFVIVHDLIANVDPVQYSVRLLVPNGSLLLGEAALTAHLTDYHAARLGWMWAHPDPTMDDLQAQIAGVAEAQIDHETHRSFEEIDVLIRSAAAGPSGRPIQGSVSTGPPGDRAHLSEPWFCCSEPTEAQLAPSNLWADGLRPRRPSGEAPGVLSRISSDGGVDRGGLLDGDNDRLERRCRQGAGHLLGAHARPLATECATNTGRRNALLLGHRHDVALRLSLDRECRQRVGEHHQLPGVDPHQHHVRFGGGLRQRPVDHRTWPAGDLG
ncbi:MAG: radical SAM protein [Actinomycetota bacterium]|nr:radical SAM protein [Actinomycetota bacterium]